MYSFVILDDQKETLNKLEKIILTEVPDAIIHQFQNVQEMCDAFPIISETAIFIIDVILKNENGIDAAKKINASFPFAQIIFISAYLDTATEVYEVDHCYYIYKPQIQAKLPAAIDKAINTIKKARKKISIQLKDRTVMLFLNEIIYMERNRRTTYIHTIENTIETSLKISQLMSELPNNFVQCHTSYIVNLDYLLEFQRTQITLRNSKLIPVSRSHLSDVRDALQDFLVK